MRVTSKTEDDNGSIEREVGGTGLAKTVAATSSHTNCITGLGISINRGNVDLAVRTTIRASR